MGDTTDELLDLAQQVTPLPPGREMDMLLTAGERISMALLAMAIANLGHTARSFTGSQAGVITDSAHGKARIIDVTPGRIRGALDDGDIAIVAGFQGVSADSKDITTLGRGGSDTTAVALAAALHADVCEIYTDVDGVYTADPRIVPNARKIERLSNEEMLEMAACGAKILHLRCVEYARRFDMPIHVRSSFSYREGTLIVTQPEEEGDNVEAPIIAGVAHDRSEAKITVVGVPDHPGKAAEIFQAVADAEINIDMIVQNVSAVETGLTDISFTLPKTDGQDADLAIGLWQCEGDVGQSGLHGRDVLDDHVDVDLGIGDSLEDLGRLAGVVRDADDGDLGFAAVVSYTGNDRGFHVVSFFFCRLSDDQRALAVGERGAHVDRYVEPPGVLDASQMQDPCPARGHLEHLLVGEPVDLLGVRHDPRVGGEDPIDVGVDLTDVRVQRGSERDRGRVRAATPEGRDVLAV